MPTFDITQRSCRCRFCSTPLSAGDLRISTKDLSGRFAIDAHHHWACYLTRGKYKDPSKIYGYDHLSAEVREEVDNFVDALADAKKAERAAAKAALKAKKVVVKEDPKVLKPVAGVNVVSPPEAAPLAGVKRLRS